MSTINDDNAVVSTAELSAFEVAHARSHDAMHVDVDGMGFVKRSWLAKFRAAVNRQAPKRYGAAHGTAGYTLTEIGSSFGDVMAGHLARDLIAARDALAEANADMEAMERSLYLMLARAEQTAEDRLVHAHRLQEQIDAIAPMASEAEAFRATCLNQRKELKALNRLHSAQIDKTLDAQREAREAREACERLRLRGIGEDDSYDPYQRLRDIVDEECGMQPAKLPTGTMLSMIENALFKWRQRAMNAERDAFAQGRSEGRLDVAKYSNAIGQIESVLGIAGAQSLDDTVKAVRMLRDEKRCPDAKK